MVLSPLNAALSPSRSVLIHAHLFKNAGSTFDWSLRRSFGERFVDHGEDDAMRRGSAYLGPYLEAQVQLQALSSHWITFPLPELRRTHLHLALFFREPLERVRSVYDFERRQLPADTRGARKAKEVGFGDYVRWSLEPQQGPVIRNFHTRCCSGDFLGDDPVELYEKAVTTLYSTQCLGLVHRYDESVVLFEHLLSEHFPDLDLSYLPQNVAGGTEGTVEHRRQAVLAELREGAEELLIANQFDLRLHALVERNLSTTMGHSTGLIREQCPVW